MKIFLTGGTGFIGSHFINEAHRHGHEIVALKRKGSCPKVDLHKEPCWVDGKLDDDFTEDVFRGCEVFVHLAAHSTNVPYDSLQNCLYWNVDCSLKLAELAFRSGIVKFSIAGSCFEYGKTGERYDFVPVDAPLEPVGTYPISKAASSLVLTSWARSLGVKLKYLRIFQAYGDGELESRFWPSMRKAALSGRDFSMSKGEQMRDFIPVQEVARALVRELDFEHCGSAETYIRNIGTGVPLSLKDFAESWWNRWAAKGELRVGELPYRPNELMRLVAMV